MEIKFYNTLTKRKETFLPLDPPRVKMYVCGVTVYDLLHIGHARSLVVFDVLYRYLKYRGYEVIYVRNFTDIDDKIINRAKEEGVDFRTIAERYISEFYVDTTSLGLEKPTFEPKATEHIMEMIEAVKKLLEKGYAYVADGDVYFSVEKFPSYGKLSGRTLEGMLAGARVEPDPKKKNPLDFALWKASKSDEPYWESPWGRGRPGWHLECSVMSQKYLGETLDIHGGGEDLIFPHHENEIAQSEALTGKPFVRFWLHNAFVKIEGEKMSKSLGNVILLREILRTYHPEALRLFLLSKHYRTPIDYSPEGIKEAQRALERLYGMVRRAKMAEGLKEEGLNKVKELALSLKERFEEALSDDLNTARALGALFELLREVNKIQGPLPKEIGERILEGLEVYQRIFGILKEDPEEFFEKKKKKKLKEIGLSLEELEGLIKKREEARKTKDWETADKIRSLLSSFGIKLMDTPQGTKWDVDE
jgi:cysteinyl-tRNA synthetase